MADNQARMGRGKKVMIILILLLLVLTAGVYAYGVYYFSNHFLPGSVVNGCNCSYMTEEETEALLASQVEVYVLTVETRNNGRESLTASQVGLRYVPDGSVKQRMLEQNRFLWFLAFDQSETYEMTVKTDYDSEKTAAAVDGLKCMQPENRTEPTDACLSDNGTEYVILPEEEGCAPDRDKVLKLVETAVETGRRSIRLEEENCYARPEIFRDDAVLLRQCEQLNRMTAAVITYDFADRTERIGREQIKSWLKIDENQDYVPDRELVGAYVDELADIYDTRGGIHEFLTYDNREITVSGGDYGWEIDRAAETGELCQAIAEGRIEVREPVYRQTAASRDVMDIGYTYVEIDLSNQVLVYYQDGIVTVNTFIVSGNPNYYGCATPTGCYEVTAMESSRNVEGEGYPEEYVTYWMEFRERTGIHAAPWREQFGGSLYLTEGSAGSVSMPYDQAELLYSCVEIGTPVVIYE